MQDSFVALASALKANNLWAHAGSLTLSSVDRYAKLISNRERGAVLTPAFARDMLANTDRRKKIKQIWKPNNSNIYAPTGCCPSFLSFFRKYMFIYTLWILCCTHRALSLWRSTRAAAPHHVEVETSVGCFLRIRLVGSIHADG